jgi:C1A family cysteine protease
MKPSTATSTKGRKYTWTPSRVHASDPIKLFTVTHMQKAIPIVDLRPVCAPVFDQGQIGSCTANALAAAYEFDMAKQHEKHVFRPSRLFIYWNERVIEGTTDQDAGAQIKDGVTTLAKTGICPEYHWPYDESQFAVQPPQAAFDEAKKHVATGYHVVVQTLPQLKQALLNGFPIVFGFTVYDSFENGNWDSTTGMMPMPASTEQVLGGHAVLIVGYDDTKQAFIVRNSWGPDWSILKGYFYMPYQFVCDSNQCSDFWTVTSTSDSA